MACSIDFVVHRGDYLGVVGPNGCGKTTLLKTMLGILPAVGGALNWKDGVRPRIGYVPQRDSMDSIYPFRVIELVTLALRAESIWCINPGVQATKVALEALARVGMADLKDKSYSELSGGQRQRLLLARAFATQPEVLALDEPTSGLDPGNAERILDLVDTMRREQSLTIILVSHDLSLIARRTSHSLLMYESRHAFGPTDAVMTTEQLTDLYQYPMRVSRQAGLVTVLPGTPRNSGV